jgi:hypothetical protein
MTKKELKIQAFGKKLMQILKYTRNVLQLPEGGEFGALFYQVTITFDTSCAV